MSNSKDIVNTRILPISILKSVNLTPNGITSLIILTCNYDDGNDIPHYLDCRLIEQTEQIENSRNKLITVTHK